MHFVRVDDEHGFLALVEAVHGTTRSTAVHDFASEYKLALTTKVQLSVLSQQIAAANFIHGVGLSSRCSFIG